MTVAERERERETASGARSAEPRPAEIFVGRATPRRGGRGRRLVARLPWWSVLVVAVVAANAVVLVRVAQRPPPSAAPAVEQPAPTVKPCTLLTAAEAEAALGSPVEVTEAPASCRFVPSEQGEFAALGIGVSPTRITDPAMFAAAVKALAQAGETELVAVPNLGDAAFYTRIDRGVAFSQVAVHKGERMLIALLLGGGQDATNARALLVDVATKAAARL